jgi:hypothetical protein
MKHALNSNAYMHGGSCNNITIEMHMQTLDGDNGVIELDCHKQSRADLHCTLG